MNDEIEIVINGQKQEVPRSSTIAYLIEHFSERDVHLIVEHNNRCIYSRYYLTTKVEQGDSIEFINPNFGG